MASELKNTDTFGQETIWFCHNYGYDRQVLYCGVLSPKHISLLIEKMGPIEHTREIVALMQ